MPQSQTTVFGSRLDLSPLEAKLSHGPVPDLPPLLLLLLLDQTGLTGTKFRCCWCSWFVSPDSPQTWDNPEQQPETTKACLGTPLPFKPMQQHHHTKQKLTPNQQPLEGSEWGQLHRGITPRISLDTAQGTRDTAPQHLEEPSSPSLLCHQLHELGERTPKLSNSGCLESTPLSSHGCSTSDLAHHGSTT